VLLLLKIQRKVHLALSNIQTYQFIDIKGSPSAKSPATPQAVGKPAVLNADNVPRTVIRAPESITEIKANISKLVDEEIEFLSESSGVAGALSSDVAKDFLEQSKFKVE
jgi:hypothetical protein